MDFDSPDPESYGRVTNPERYQAVVDAARDMIAHLVKTYQVEVIPGSRSVDFPDWTAGVVEVSRFRPSQGAPLALLFTEFPGVVVRVGDWAVEGFPACGCDACNESPQEVVGRLNDLVNAAVEGSYEEELTKRQLTYTIDGGSSSSERRLGRGQWKRLWRASRTSVASLGEALVGSTPTCTHLKVGHYLVFSMRPEV